MAATPSRRVLGPLDGNKPLQPSPMLSSPGKRANTTSFDVSRDVDPALQKIGSPTMSQTTFSSRSPLRSAKRQRVEGDMEIVKKRRAMSGDDVGTNVLQTGQLPDDLQVGSKGLDDGGHLGSEHAETRSSHRYVREPSSPSTFHPVDSSRSSILSENLSEPEVTSTTEPIPYSEKAQAISVSSTHREARENAEALRLRLKVAMYKVRTNQVSLPLSQLSIVSSRQRSQQSKNNNFNARDTSRDSQPARVPESTSTQVHNSDSVDTVTYSSPATVKASQGRLIQERIPQLSAPDDLSRRNSLAASPLPSPSKGDSVTPLVPRSHDATITPVLPRSRDGLALEANEFLDWDREGDKELTSSVVKKGAADGLLRLMGGFEQ